MRLALLLVFASIGASVSAQFTFGIVTGGVNARTEFFDGIDVNTDNKWGVSAGVQFGLPVAKHLGLHPELCYRQKGFEEIRPENTPWVDPYRYRWTYDYLDLSLMLRYYTSDAPRGAYLGAGPWLGTLLGGRIRDMNAGSFAPGYSHVVQEGPVAAFDPRWLGYTLVDYGWCAGAGLSLPLGGTWIGAEIRYQKGYANVHNGYTVYDLNGARVGELNSMNNCTMLNISWLVPVGKG